MYVVEYHIGQELPGLSFTWPLDDGTPADLSTGFEGSIIFAHVDHPTVDLTDATVTSGITLAGAVPGHFSIDAWANDTWANLVTAWGKTLPEHGTWFELRPHLVRTSGTKDWRWPGPNTLLRLRP